jgi:hypothetical protein
MSSIVIQGDTSGSITVEAPSVAGTHTLTLPKATGNIATDATVGLGTKNLVINGGMVIDQRNAGAEVIPANDAYTLDRWKYNASQASKLKVQQNAQAITGPVGFKNYLGVTVNTPYTVTASDNFMISQAIEGFNSAHLEFGTANAKTITVSFWVQSSLTGTFSGSLQNSAENRSYPFEYTISSANTWEYKTITITGDTSGTWIGATNGKGLKIWFSLGMGSNFTGTANQWNGAQDFASSGEAVKLVENSAAQWKITGVQLEVGENATPFENRMYSQELAMCQRYYFTAQTSFHSTDTTGIIPNLQFPVTMRATPSVSWSYGGVDWDIYHIPTGATPNYQSLNGFFANTNGIKHGYKFGAGLTAASFYDTIWECTAEL